MATVAALFMLGAFIVVLLSPAPLAESATDTDGDGYGSIASGGTDCVDQIESTYSTGTASCDATATPSILESSGDPDSTNDIADHAWIQGEDGTWHLYFQWNLQGSGATAGTDIAHFTTTDFQSITQVGNALENDNNGTYYDHIWSPYVIKNGDAYYMFFTGVEYFTGAFSKQRIGLATSTDLTNWTRYPANFCDGTGGNGCIYECDNSWTTWGDGTAYDEQCRDPMVMRDATNNRWVMFSTIKRNDGGGSEAIDVAYSTDLVHWTGAGYIKATQRLSGGQGGVGGQTTGGTSENPFAFEHDGTYYLTFTDWSDAEPPAMVQYVKSSTLLADSSGSTNWTYQGSIPDRGVNAIEIVKPYSDTWLMTESVSNNGSGYPSNIRDLLVKRIVWAQDGTFTTENLSKLSCRVASSSINPGAAEICGDNVDNNCSSTTDEALYCNACVDGDGDGYGSAGTLSCTKTALDCNDASSSIKPGATELCDAVDNDCDGSTDENNVCACVESWTCGAWTACSGGTQTRVCTDANTCGTTTYKPAVQQFCDVATAPVIVTGTRSGGGPDVRIFGTDGVLIGRFSPYTSTLRSGVNVAMGDLDGDGRDEIVTAPGVGGASHVRVFTAHGVDTGWSTFAYGTAFRGGVSVAVGDIDGDGRDEIVTAPMSGGPNIRIFGLRNGTLVPTTANFLAYGTTFRNGVNVAMGDLDGDGKDEIVTTPVAGSTHLRIFGFRDGSFRSVMPGFFAYGATSRLGLVTALGDTNSDGREELAMAVASGGGPHVRTSTLTDAGTLALMSGGFFAYHPVFRGGVSIAACDLTNDGNAELVTVPAGDGSAVVRTWNVAGGWALPQFTAYESSYTNGATLACGER